MPNSAPGDPGVTDYLWKIHSHTNDYIRFADQKAAIAIAVESTIIGAMYAAKFHQACSPARLNVGGMTLPDTTLGVCCTLAFALLVAGMFCGVVAVAPRLWHEYATTLRSRVVERVTVGVPKGAIYWGQVVQHKTEVEYAHYVSGLDAAQRQEAVAHHVYAIAQVATRKYFWVQLCLAFGAVGGAVALVLLLLN